MGRLDRVRILIEPWLPLRGFAGDKAVEIIEAVTGGPTIEGAHRGGRHPPVCCAICRTPRSCSRSTSGPRGWWLNFGNNAGVAVPVDSKFSDGAVANALGVAAGQQRCSRRRADGRGVEGVVGDAGSSDSRQGRSVNHATICISLRKSGIVQHDDQDVGWISQPHRRLTPVDELIPASFARRHWRTASAGNGSTRPSDCAGAALSCANASASQPGATGQPRSLPSTTTTAIKK